MRYKTRLIWSVPIVIAFAIILALIIPALLENISLLKNIWTIVAILGMIFLSLNALFGIYISIENKNVSQVDGFLWKIVLPIEDIETVQYLPSFILGGPNKTVFVQGKVNNKAKTIKMTSMAFGPKSQSLFVKMLLDQNPGIHLNNEAKELIERSTLS